MRHPFTWLAAALLGAAALAPAQAAEGWQTVRPRGSIVGADGQPHRATCSGFPGTNPAYRFWVRPGDPSKLAVVFDGGGACWDDLTCSHPERNGPRDPLLQFYTPAIPAGSDPSSYDGLLDLANAANPVKDWTLVAIPYCTADVHLGSADHTYTRTVAGQARPFTLRHRGYDNFMVVLDWISRNVAPGVTDLLVTGASAGGYGATAHAPWLAQQFPGARLSVLADASQGVRTDTFDAVGRQPWNPQLAPFVFGADPIAVPSNDLMRRIALAYPAGRFAQYTTTQDAVQSGFYGYMKLFYGPGGSCPGIVPDWNNQMLQKLTSDRASLSNFHYYVQGGDSHTIIGENAFYETTPAGASMADWTRAMLDPAAPAGLWADAACPDCLVPLPCRAGSRAEPFR